MSKILYLDLAFENYDDDTQNHDSLLIKTWEKLGYLRENRNILEENEKLKLSQEILDDFEKILDIVGREKFNIYDDGSILYKWPKKEMRVDERR